jgi:hypothetical protein
MKRGPTIRRSRFNRPSTMAAYATGVLLPFRIVSPTRSFSCTSIYLRLKPFFLQVGWRRTPGLLLFGFDERTTWEAVPQIGLPRFDKPLLTVWDGSLTDRSGSSRIPDPLGFA